MVTVTETIVPN